MKMFVCYVRVVRRDTFPFMNIFSHRSVSVHMTESITMTSGPQTRKSTSCEKSCEKRSEDDAVHPDLQYLHAQYPHVDISVLQRMLSTLTPHEYTVFMDVCRDSELTSWYIPVETTADFPSHLGTFETDGASHQKSNYGKNRDSVSPLYRKGVPTSKTQTFETYLLEADDTLTHMGMMQGTTPRCVVRKLASQVCTKTCPPGPSGPWTRMVLRHVESHVYYVFIGSMIVHQTSATKPKCLVYKALEMICTDEDDGDFDTNDDKTKHHLPSQVPSQVPATRCRMVRKEHLIETVKIYCVEQESKRHADIRQAC